jgi:hypothetical protein
MMIIKINQIQKVCHEKDDLSPFHSPCPEIIGKENRSPPRKKSRSLWSPEEEINLIKLIEREVKFTFPGPINWLRIAKEVKKAGENNIFLREHRNRTSLQAHTIKLSEQIGCEVNELKIESIMTDEHNEL